MHRRTRRIQRRGPRSTSSATAFKLSKKASSELEGEDGQLEAVVFKSGRRLPRRALFFDTPCVSRSQLARKLGCQITRKGAIRCGQYEATSVPGVFVAGNLIKDVQLAIVAAAEGTRAAFGINRSLTREDFERRATGAQHVEHPSVDDKTSRGAGRRVRC